METEELTELTELADRYKELQLKRLANSEKHLEKIRRAIESFRMSDDDIWHELDPVIDELEEKFIEIWSEAPPKNLPDTGELLEPMYQTIGELKDVVKAFKELDKSLKQAAEWDDEDDEGDEEE